VVRDADRHFYSVRYEAVNAMCLTQFVKEYKKVEEQQAAISQLNSVVAAQQTAAAEQQKELKALAATVKEQAAQIQKISAQFEVNKPGRSW
jgi:uncharacterized coiled-coil protein SlyX